MSTTMNEFVRDLQRVAGQRQAQIAEKLVNHKVANWDEYNKETGRAAGIGELANLAYELMKNRDLGETDTGTGLAEMPADPSPRKTGGKK